MAEPARAVLTIATLEDYTINNGAMSARRIHRIVGLVMLLPLVGWAVTGAIFFIKPGYGGAYESLPIKTYPIDRPIAITPQAGWTEIRYLKTVLGEHVLARSPQGWLHLDAATLAPKPSPSAEGMGKLMQDSFSANPSRYGRILNMEGLTATTDSGVKVTLDWKRLTLSQSGRDTARIDWIYKIHYLQWTGITSVDRVLGGVGLLLLVALSSLGAWIFVRGGRTLTR